MRTDTGGNLTAAQHAGRAARHKPNGVRLRTVALPTEHGGWGLSLEPVALGLVLAASPTAFCLAVATLGAFLARHPLKIAAADWRRRQRFPRTAAAERFALLYGGVAAASFAAAVALAPSPAFLLPLLLAAPMAVVQLFYDCAGRSRALWPELSGATALAAVAAAAALAGGWAAAPAFGLWAVLAARVVPTILYVRARLLRLRGKPAATAPVFVAHAAAAVAVLALARAGVVPWLAVAAVVALLARTLAGFRERGAVTAKRVGVRELAFGVMTVTALAAGHLLRF
jgi:hypothetical protein